MLSAPKFLFVPVSSAEGIGEYMRSKIIADEVLRRWPKSQISFALNRQAPYVKQCPYATYLLDDTPTKKIKEVNQLVSELKPDVVVFDAAGRKAQLKHAHKLGAKVVFISQHRRKRTRGMKIGRALVTDSHWVVQPEFVIGDISRIERLKLEMIDVALPLFTGPIFTHPNVRGQELLYRKYELKPGQYLIYSAGSGGHMANDRLAADLFAEVAQAIYKKTAIASVMVFGPNYPNPLPKVDGVIAIEQLSNDEFINLLDGAKGAVLSGGDTLLQAIALNTPTLAVAVSKDQPDRIKKCLAQSVILSCSANFDEMLNAGLSLIEEKTIYSLKARMGSCSSLNGLDLAMDEMKRLINLT